MLELIHDGHHFSAGELGAMLEQIAEVLDYLHGRMPPILHRDVKPANVIRDGESSYTLVDFGGAYPSEAGDAADHVVATPGYTPVEHYYGEDPSPSDFYALSTTLLHASSHRHPNEFESYDLQMDIPDHCLPDGPAGTTIRNLLQPDAENRPASLEDVRASLDEDASDAASELTERADQSRATIVRDGDELHVTLKGSRVAEGTPWGMIAT